MIFPKVPTVLFLKLAVIGLLMAFAYGVGNLHATDRLLREREELGARTQAKNHEALILWYRDRMKEIRLDQEKQKAADVAAYATLSEGKAESDRQATEARTALNRALGANSKLTETNDGLKAVAEIQATEARKPAPGCIMPPGVRQSINDYIARINAAPTVGAARSPATGLPLEPPGSDTVLTCRQLAGSVIDILQTAADYVAHDMAWRTWANEALR